LFSGDDADVAVGVPGSSATGVGLTGPSATEPVPVPVPGPVVSVGPAGLSLTVGSGELDVGGCSTEFDGFGLPPPPVPGFVWDLVGVGSGFVDVPGAAGSADAPEEAPLVPAEGDVPSLAVGVDPAGTLPVPEGTAESAGREVGSTWPAGFSSFWPGTGSQGASELPDSKVITMTTA
jgi:hypothetical protein